MNGYYVPTPSEWEWDDDGEFLLIETAFHLPRWLKPETAANRVWLCGGEMRVVPPEADARLGAWARAPGARHGGDRTLGTRAHCRFRAISRWLPYPKDSPNRRRARASRRHGHSARVHLFDARDGSRLVGTGGDV